MQKRLGASLAAFVALALVSSHALADARSERASELVGAQWVAIDALSGAPNWRRGAPAMASRAAWRAGVSAYRGGSALAREALSYGGFGRGQCVDLVRRVANIPQGVREWRRGIRATDMRLPVGTPVATFLNRNGTPSDRYDGGVGVGAPGNNTTHAAIVAGYDERGDLEVLEQYAGSGGPRLAIYRRGDPRGGEKDAGNYFSINGVNGKPLGSRNPLAKFVRT